MKLFILFDNLKENAIIAPNIAPCQIALYSNFKNSMLVALDHKFQYAAGNFSKLLKNINRVKFKCGFR